MEFDGVKGLMFHPVNTKANERYQLRIRICLVIAQSSSGEKVKTVGINMKVLVFAFAIATLVAADKGNVCC